jgi:hypothetical protein
MLAHQERSDFDDLFLGSLHSRLLLWPAATAGAGRRYAKAASPAT